MPCYFFSVNDENPSDSGGGVECENDEAARLMAKRTLAAIVADHLRTDSDDENCTVYVTNEAGEPIYSGWLMYAGRTAREPR